MTTTHATARPSRRAAVAAFGALALAAATVVVTGGSPTEARSIDPAVSPVPAIPAQEWALPTPGPMRDRPFELRGAAAVKYLEARGDTAEVAANASMSVPNLVDELQHDPLMFVTGDGMVGFTEPIVSVAEIGAGGDAGAPAVGEAIGVDVFTLHSRPGSTRVVYLDFDGHTTTGDYWNSTYSVAEIVSAPYSIDGSSAFSDTELQRIHDIWKVVADDYAPFNVDVTTQQPPAGGLVKSSAGDTSYGQRVVISPTDWYYASQQRSIGGIALIDVFSANFDHSAFVFSNNLAGGSVKAVSEAASHEAGHTFGLLHDGVSPSTAYYAGHGDWAPIMGVGYSEPITQWSRGEYTGANNTEDDLALIQDHAPVVTDDHGNTVGTATAVDPTASVTGLLAVNDVDVFTATVGAGSLSAAVTPTGNNLHATVTVRNAGGQVVASGSPQIAVGWSSVASASVPAGTYTFTVERAGWLTATTGFTAYASLGGYTLAVAGQATGATTTTTTTTTVPTPPPPPPTSTPTSTTTTTTTTTTPTTTPTSPPTTNQPPTTQPPTTQPPTTDPPVIAGSSLVAVAPVRLLDTRSGVGGSRRLPAGGTAVVQVAGRNGVPSTATAAVLTLTAVAPGDAGYLSIFPCASGPSGTSTVNYAAGQVIANTTLATLDASGRVCVMSLADADVLVDMTGWLAEGVGSRLRPVGPIRVADTRSGQGGSTRLAAGGTMTLDLARWAGADASAVALNVTVVDPASAGYLTAYPCGGALPTTSTVNHRAGEARPNNTIVGLGHGKVCVFSLAEADVLVDLVGVFGATGLAYVPTQPARVLDTRDFGDALAPSTEVEYVVAGPAGVDASAASVNVTAVGHTGDGFTSTYACDALPDTSTLNQFVGQIAANGAIVPLTPFATSCAWTLSGGHVLVDLNGWWI